ncbi:MAG: ACT domain-containing protein [Oscillibacter sp.]|nr:ACT domain-containing protein [Oscillibacter sp.]MBR1689901.1 ACT domain-containing protein [Oscillibacter sp.]
MRLKKLDFALSVCQVADVGELDLERPFYFIARTGEELSLVCRTEDVPPRTLAREDGWRGFYIQGTLDFSLVGILSRLSAILAENHIGLFAVSTYNTDYILVKAEQLDRALDLLGQAGYEVAEG